MSDILVSKTLDKPIKISDITSIELPQTQHFTVVVKGKDTCIFVNLKDMPVVVRDWILSQAESQIKGV